MLIRSKKDAILIPVPHYPLYQVLTTLNNGTAVPYYLEEESNWSVNPQSLKKTISDAKAKNLDIRSIVLINPNNPTGSIMSRQNLE
jgi:alanine transaminase